MKTPVYFFFLFVSAGFISCKPNVDPSVIIARQGKMDLSTWDKEKTGPIALDGEWEFYYNQLLSPADFKNHPSLRPDTFMVVPGYWNNQTGTKKFTGQGYATYRLQLKNYHYKGLPAIRVMDNGSAYRLWVNDEYVAGNGTVSANRDAVVPQFLPLVRNASIQSDSLQIIVQIANFFHDKPGIWRSIELGDRVKIMTARDNSRNAELLIAGAMFILFIYHIFIFLLRRKEYASFWFALLCLDSTVRILFTGERIIYSMFPGFSLYAGFRIEYLTVTLGVPMYVMVAYEFFKVEWSKTASGEPFFQIRIGVHTGPVLAGIVGSKKFAYDIWGDTVNLAARMKSTGEINKVNISGATWQMVKDKFNCTHRGKIEAKYKGAVDMYFAEKK